MILTIGNHDIISRHEFEKIGLECVNTYTISPFIFMHDKQGKTNTDFLPVSGHIHPAVKLRTRGRQNIFTPCYYVGNSNILLPAFGTFTGTYLIEPGQNDLVFAIVDGEVVDVSSLI
jgi:metallophosphoesterase superfamily enzyme